MSYLIKLADDLSVFNLYRHGKFVCAKDWIGQHLLTIGYDHGIDVSRCQSESHMLSILSEHVLIEIGDD